MVAGLYKPLPTERIFILLLAANHNPTKAMDSSCQHLNISISEPTQPGHLVTKNYVDNLLVFGDGGASDTTTKIKAASQEDLKETLNKVVSTLQCNEKLIHQELIGLEETVIGLKKHLETVEIDFEQCIKASATGIDVQDSRIINVGPPQELCDAVNKAYVEEFAASKQRVEELDNHLQEVLFPVILSVKKLTETFALLNRMSPDLLKLQKLFAVQEGVISINNNRLSQLGAPILDSDAVCKSYLELYAPSKHDMVNALNQIQQYTEKANTNISLYLENMDALTTLIETLEVLERPWVETLQQDVVQQDVANMKAQLASQWGINQDGSLHPNQRRVIGIEDPINPMEASNKRYVDTVLLDKENVITSKIGMLEKRIEPFGGVFSFSEDSVSVNHKRLCDSLNPIHPGDVVTLDYLQSHTARKEEVSQLGESLNTFMTTFQNAFLVKEDVIEVNNKPLRGLSDPINSSDAVTLNFLQTSLKLLSQQYTQGETLLISMMDRIYSTFDYNNWEESVNFGQRRLTNLVEGTDDKDAVNVIQLNKASLATETLLHAITLEIKNTIASINEENVKLRTQVETLENECQLLKEKAVSKFILHLYTHQEQPILADYLRLHTGELTYTLPYNGKIRLLTSSPREGVTFFVNDKPLTAPTDFTTITAGDYIGMSYLLPSGKRPLILPYIAVDFEYLAF